MNHLLSFLCMGVLLLAGCQKDADRLAAGNGAPGETTDGRLLSRIVFQHSATDSSFTDLQYDAKGRWMGSKTNNDAPVLNDYVQTRVYRSAAGTAFRYVTRSNADRNADSTVYRLLYNGTQKRYAAKIKIDNRTGEASDSTVYEYENNRIAAAHLFMRAAAVSPYIQKAKAVFTYSPAGNLATLHSFILNPRSGTGFVPVSETRFIYDDKINPLNLGTEALVLDQVFFVSANNIIHIFIKNAANTAAPEEVLDFIYQYHASDKPRSAELKSSLKPVPMFFRYQ